MSAWDDLSLHQQKPENFNLRTLLAHPNRFQDFSIQVEDMLFDFSKHLATPETLRLLVNLAQERNLISVRDAMFRGDKINTSEDRAVLHVALRAPESSKLEVDGEDVMPYIHTVLKRMRSFSSRVIAGEYTGYTGKHITDVVNLGIGGSDLGPRFVTEALRDYRQNLQVHFVSNVDGAAINDVLQKLNPETTLFIIASKTFTTEETMLNANIAKEWFISKAGSSESVSRHFIALSTNERAVKDFGINPDLMFPFRDWVGGRYSLWSAIGLSIMLSIGPDHFDQLLAGAHTMDTHFKTAPLERNVPVLMGLLGVWYRNFWNYPTQLILPYNERLAKLAKFIQQMDMESNGKAVKHDGSSVTYDTGAALFGASGTDSQHSFMQLAHQGTTTLPADFIVCAKSSHPFAANHLSVLSNCLAQSRALAIGQTLEEANNDPFKVMKGNRPSTTIALSEISPFSLGLLLAAYEHKVFVQGIIWGLNSFDQPGVELGKKLAKDLKPILKGEITPDSLDQSTKGLIAYLGKI